MDARSASPDIVICNNREALARDAAYRFTALALQAISEGRPFRVALSGGSTPRLLYAQLAAPPFQRAIDWSRVEIFFGDERAVPPDAPDSNYRMARDALLAHLPVPAEQIHRMPAEQPDLDAAAQDYEQTLRRAFAPAPGEWPRFDLILLGMGPDGHCASLFPGRPALLETRRLVVATEPGLAPFVPRLTLTFPVINHSAHVLFLIAGMDKAHTVAHMLLRDLPADQLPVLHVSPEEGNVTYLLDREAALLVPSVMDTAGAVGSME
ncbi:MAG: 6-phosphogluconolactonase [Chthonomonadaceae bacterium]|nr:6-phosphogluconolactonase [Chthonomonadaceae bacterium]